MSGKTEQKDMINSLIHKTITASNAYVKGCEEDVINHLAECIKVSTSLVTQDEEMLVSSLFTHRLNKAYIYGCTEV